MVGCEKVASESIQGGDLLTHSVPAVVLVLGLKEMDFHVETM